MRVYVDILLVYITNIYSCKCLCLYAPMNSVVPVPRESTGQGHSRGEGNGKRYVLYMYIICL